nr:MAG TPA: hypothetical protein [Caudoviricetes sp.]
MKLLVSSSKYPTAEPKSRAKEPPPITHILRTNCSKSSHV